MTNKSIHHPNEHTSNAIRDIVMRDQPLCQRTYTPSLAVISRSEGNYHYTPEGRKLADFTSGVLVVNLGHHPCRWWKAVWKYMGLENCHGTDGFTKAVPLTAYNAISEVEALATRRLLENMKLQSGGARMQQVLWAASGSEAIQKALWAALAFKHPADRILATRYGFHGKKGLAGAVTGTERDADRDPRVTFLDFPREACGTWQRRNQPLDLSPVRSQLASLKEVYGDALCCLVTEPYLGGGGSFHPQPEYLQLLQQFCRDNDMVFILDEVQSNFGRTGNMYAYTTYGLEPDIVVLGKGMANGMPVDAAVGRADIFAALGYGAGSDTWSGHPIGCAAVLATLDEFEQHGVLTQAAELATTLQRGLNRLTELPAISAVRGEGTVWGVQCAAIGEKSANEVANEIVRRCYLGDEHGRAIHLLGPLAGTVLRVAPPLVMPPVEAEEYLDVMFNIVALVSP